MTGGQATNLLDRNLTALGERSRAAVEAVRRAAPAGGAAFERAPDGGTTGVLERDGSVRRLASARAPRDEAARLISTVDLSQSAAVVVLGLGAGEHAAELARRLGASGAVFIFEPDAGLVRALFESVDCSGWIGASNVVLLTDAGDAASMAVACTGLEGILAAGTVLLEHPPSRARLGECAGRFSSGFAGVMRAVRTNVLTTLVQVEASVRNQVQNLRWYTRAPGIGDLAGACRGSAAVVVSAGPSLHGALEVLARPGLRDRVVIIAVQTVLGTLLERGIRPHFVTALDHHEISRRFYEGLTPEMVDGVTLVAEMKANPAILAAFPGRVRCVGDDVLDRLLPPDLVRPMGGLTPGATVAHLAYYLARHLGCDPVILAGQDLAFTDGLYYAPGAAIHRVWGGELSEFRTLEMFEWERIARMRRTLRAVEGQDGRPVYTDEQMHTYLVQFERDFLGDRQRGLTTIDATGGGVRKRHAEVMSLEEAIGRHAPGTRRIGVPPTPGDLPAERAARAEEHLRSLKQDVAEIGALSRRTADLLARMQGMGGDQARLSPLIAQAQANARAAAGLSRAFWLVQYVNQSGQLNRFRDDRAIDMLVGSEIEKQGRRIERDLRNVRRLGEIADRVGELLSLGAGALAGERLVTRDQPPARDARPARTRRIPAIIAADAEFNGLGLARDLAAPTIGGRSNLALVLERLSRCEGIDRAIILTPTPRAIGALAAGSPLPVEIVPADERAFRERQRRVGAGRMWSRHAWRGGLGNLAVFDEAIHPEAFGAIMERERIDAALVMHADWALADPALIDACVRRHAEADGGQPVTFTQAPPGLCGCVVSRTLVQELRQGGPFASVGGMLGYVPVRPMADAIAHALCVPVDAAVRDLGARLIPDCPASARWLAGVEGAAGGATPDAAALARAIAAGLATQPGQREIIVDLAPDAGAPHVIAALSGVRDARSCAITLGPDLLAVERWREVVEAATGCCAAVHVRTRLACDEGVADALFDAAPRVISVDLLAHEAGAYRRITGTDGYARARGNLERLIERRGGHFPPATWIVPRITRRDCVLDQIDAFYDHWLVHAGACVIDPAPGPAAGERLTALPLPPGAARRLERDRLYARVSPAAGERRAS